MMVNLKSTVENRDDNNVPNNLYQFNESKNCNSSQGRPVYNK